MSYHSYTLDRFEGDYAIFLKRPEETEQLLIRRDEISVFVSEGDIVRIQDNGLAYTVEVLQEETAAKNNDVQNLLQQLKNRKQ